MDTNDRYYKWIEPTLIIQKDRDNKTSYLLYNKISNFAIKEDKFKIVNINVDPKDKTEFSAYKTNYRLDYISYLKNLYPESYASDSGFSSALDAIKLINENLIMLFKNFTLMGAISYEISDKKKSIIISHIGVIEKRKGYGSVLMNELFSLAKILNYKIEVTSNGYADPFYHFCGMIRTVDKPLGIYTIKPDYIKDIERLVRALKK